MHTPRRLSIRGWTAAAVAMVAVGVAASGTSGQESKSSPRPRVLITPPVAPRQQAAVLSEPDLVQAIYDDLQRMHECNRAYTRYVVFRHTYGDSPLGDFGGSKLCVQAMSRLLNSLSWAPLVFKVVAAADNDGAFLCPIDLRDLGWDARIWDRIVAEYPYGLLPEGPKARAVKSYCQCNLPYVRGDWLANAASRPPLYHDILKLPATQPELERLLRIDVDADILRSRVMRSGFKNSAISKHNRLVEWHKTGYGALWKTYDFGSNTGSADLFAHPTGPIWLDNPGAFRHDGGEIVFNLPNGFQAYMLVDGKGKRINAAPINIVTDTQNPRDPVIMNGISCMGCHSDGVKPVPEDQVRAHVEANEKTYSAAEVAAVKALHHPKEQMNAAVRDFERLFTRAVEIAGGEASGGDPVSRLSSLYDAPLTPTFAGAELGLTAHQLKGRIAASSPDLKRILASLQSVDGSVPRQVFLAAFPKIVHEWKLGHYLPSASAAGNGALPDQSKGDLQSYDTNDSTESDLPQPFDPYYFWGTVVTIMVLVPTALLFTAYRLRRWTESSRATRRSSQRQDARPSSQPARQLMPNH
jgi:hypothetical protein